MAYVIDDRLKEAAKDADREKVVKDVAMATAKDKGKATEAVEKRAQASKKAQILAELGPTEMDVKLGGIELKLAEAKCLSAQGYKIVDLKAALEA